MSMDSITTPEIKHALDLTESQTMIRDMVRDFARTEVAPIAAEIDEHHRFPLETWKKIVELGLPGIPFSEDLGGSNGGTLADLQAVQFKLANMALDIEASRHLVYHAARLKDLGQPYSKEAAIAKLFASECAMRITYDAIQIYGGMGYSREYPVERMWRDAKLCVIGEGTSEVQRLVIARNILR